MKFIQRLYTLFLLIGVVLCTSCAKDTCIHGSGPIVSRTLNIDDFNGFDLRGSFNATLQKGNELKVIAEGQENIIDQLSLQVIGGKWNIKLKEGCYIDYQLTIHIYSPNIEEFGTSSTGNIQVLNRLDSISNLSIFNSGSAFILCSDSLIIDNYLNISLNGSGSIGTKGRCLTQNINLSSSGTYNGFGMFSDECIVSLPGSGNCEINVLNSLDAFIGGSGNIYYTGNPTISATITGSGSIINSN